MGPFDEGEKHTGKVITDWRPGEFGRVPTREEYVPSLTYNELDYQRVSEINYLDQLRKWKNAYCNIPPQLFQPDKATALTMVKQLQRNITNTSIGIMYEAIGYEIKGKKEPFEIDSAMKDPELNISTQIQGLYNHPLSDYIPVDFMMTQVIPVLMKQEKEPDNDERQKAADEGNYFTIAPLSTGIGIGFATFVERLKNSPHMSEILNTNFGFAATRKGEDGKKYAGVDLTVLENIYKKVEENTDSLAIDIIDDFIDEGSTMELVIGEVYSYLKERNVSLESIKDVMAGIRIYTPGLEAGNFVVNIDDRHARWSIPGGNTRIYVDFI